MQGFDDSLHARLDCLFDVGSDCLLHAGLDGRLARLLYEALWLPLRLGWARTGTSTRCRLTLPVNLHPSES